MTRRRFQRGVSYEIVSDGRTVWVNVAAGSIARFGLAGIDIHREPMQQDAEGSCLYCTHTVTTRADWAMFVDKMLELYGIVVPDHHRPERLR